MLLFVSSRPTIPPDPEWMSKENIVHYRVGIKQDLNATKIISKFNSLIRNVTFSRLCLQHLLVDQSVLLLVTHKVVKLSEQHTHKHTRPS